MRFLRTTILLSICLVLPFLSACSPGAQGPDTAVHQYLEALVAGETDRLVNLSCTDWEAQARNELSSFTAVEVTLQDVQCTSSSIDAENAVVNCSGKIVANYGNEILEIDLSQRSYQVVKDGGEWRMCGYQ